MPIKKASWKHYRQTPKRTAHNTKIRVAMEIAVKTARKAITSKAGDVKDKVTAAIKALDRAAQKGIIKKNNAARKKSRLMKALHKSKK
ncbi:MAG: 30S ribosomal protein S20 [Patescibacteria group bacterium]